MPFFFFFFFGNCPCCVPCRKRNLATELLHVARLAPDSTSAPTNRGTRANCFHYASQPESLCAALCDSCKEFFIQRLGRQFIRKGVQWQFAAVVGQLGTRRLKNGLYDWPT